ncbi:MULTISPECIES: metal-dependent hydrolase family protein [Pacificimonas]|uniref:Amidohydrolase family protein n=1 Tax=Pacificimonas aurantium TaxID=1250540 RepID=A0ABS7WII5_9SPHN|nr:MULTISPECIES: amidohydrolase family protein [Pacificimonas]MBZ6378194.1 amidohydrolase family protein [Pacificimonas aurantium]
MLFARLVLIGCLIAPATAQAATLVYAGTLIADPSKAARGPSTVVVEGGRIEAVEDGFRSPGEGDEVIDLRDRTILPGLIDAHVHLTGDHDDPFYQGFIDTDEYAVAVGLKNAELTLEAGFTTVRDLGGAPEAVFAVGRAIEEEMHPGPRLVAAGTAVSIIGGHGDMTGVRPEIVELGGDNTCTGPVQCAERVREFSRAGADVIKIAATGGVLSQQGRGLGAHFTPEEMEAIVATARSLGLKVAAHAHGARGVEAAVRAGVSSIEHGTFIDDAGIEAMRQRGSYYVPTLLAFRGIEEQLGTGIYTPVVEKKIRQVISHTGAGLRAAYAAGVPIAYGTDAGVFAHGRNGEEAAMMVELSGLPPRAVLESATVNAADLLGIADETGTIEPGKAADLIAVDGDPMEDITALERIRFVMARGRAHDLPSAAE